jgi:DegV family protein with EDD domain
MSKVAVVTDSTAYIPPEVLRGLPIHVTPLQVLWDGQVLLDGIDITPQAFYERLKTAKVMPTTSQTTPAMFEQLYSKLLKDGYDIISIHISSHLSGTMDSAIQAKAALNSSRIVLVDSQSTAMAMGWQVLVTARAAAQGASLEECKFLAEKAREHTHMYFTVETLEFLRRGGRIGGAAAFLGTVLDLKPVLELHDGKIEAVDKVRTMNKALDRILDLTTTKVNGQTPVHLAVMHANAPEKAVKLMERVRSLYGVSEVSETLITSVSPVIGTHTGPGALGICIMWGM